jgi:hypothetical protein
LKIMRADKIMFEIYREAGYNRRFQVLYFTELNDHNRENEINRAMAGEHFYDGFIRGFKKEEAKALIDGVVQRLNRGEAVAPAEVRKLLAPFASWPH